MMHPGAIWYDILSCRDNFESSETKWCILTLFVTYARQLLGIREGITPIPLSCFIAKLDYLFFLIF